MLIGYLSVLFLAALWAVVERIRSKVQRLDSPALDRAAADSMTTRERIAEREAERQLLRST